MQVDDGFWERRIVIVIVISPDSEDMGAIIGSGGLKDNLICHITQGKDEISLSCPIPPVQFIDIGYEEKFHEWCFG